MMIRATIRTRTRAHAPATMAVMVSEVRAVSSWSVVSEVKAISSWSGVSEVKAISSSSVVSPIVTWFLQAVVQILGSMVGQRLMSDTEIGDFRQPSLHLMCISSWAKVIT